MSKTLLSDTDFEWNVNGKSNNVHIPERSIRNIEKNIMNSKERKILDVTIAPQKVSDFRESLQGGFETCEAKVFAEYIAEDVSSLFISRYALWLINAEF